MNFSARVVRLAARLLSSLPARIKNLFARAGGVAARYRPQGTPARFDNADWERVLAAAVTDDGFVRYEHLTDNRDGARDALYRYVGQVGAVSPDNRPDLFPARADELAYYLNAYNALAMYAVLERGLPANTLLSGLPGSIYLIDTFPVGGTSATLHELEDRVRRHADPRTHFALNCMSNSCPPLRRQAYAGAALDGQLADQGERYLADGRGAVPDGETVQLGGVFGMYGDDFLDAYRNKTGNADATLLEAIRGYAPADSPVRRAAGHRIMGYDWGLNRAKEPRAR